MPVLIDVEENERYLSIVFSLSIYGNPMRFNPKKHFQNRDKVPSQALQPYLGSYVAWSMDGKSIVASAKDEEDLYAALRQQTISLEQVVISYLPFPNDVLVGGVFMHQEEVRS
jgi:hypothetical protein